MKTSRFLQTLAALVLAAASLGANAQLFRAYVSSKGVDTNPCTLPAPCRLLPAAIAAVDDGGEIWMLDSANYNTATVTVDKSLTILAVPGALGSVLSTGGTVGISVNLPDLRVTLRNLNILGVGASLDGIYFGAGAVLVVEGCEIYGLQGNGIDYAAINGRLVVKDTVIRDTQVMGVVVNSGFKASIERSHLLNNALGGVNVSNFGSVTITDSVIAGASAYGLLMESRTGGRINAAIERSAVRVNGVGLASSASENASGVSHMVARDNSISGGSVGVTVEAENGATAIAVLEGNVITFNDFGVNTLGTIGTRTVNTLGNNTIRLNRLLDVNATLTPVVGF